MITHPSVAASRLAAKGVCNRIIMQQTGVLRFNFVCLKASSQIQKEKKSIIKCHNDKFPRFHGIRDAQKLDGMLFHYDKTISVASVINNKLNQPSFQHSSRFCSL